MPRLLIVDDDANLRRLLVATFGYGKYELHEACNGVDAVRLASQLRPAVILLDVMLPGELDGLEACRQIKAQPELKEIKVILLTALGQQSDRWHGELAGADAYVVKPFSPLKLIELVDSLL
ncbi:MAG: response regulator [Gallionella sp.]|nr:response regulator [Gallionella sp.]MCK9353648.1 response regulator [Gallionella sp.]